MSKNKIEDNFILLPSVKAEYNGKSSLFNSKSDFVFYSESNELPVLLSQTFNLKKGTPSNHNLSFKIDNELDIVDEGYHLNISKKLKL